MVRKALIRVLLVCLSGLSAAWAQDVYRSEDDQGVPSFSDVPGLDSKKLDIKPMNVVPATKPMDFELRLKNPSTDTSLKYKGLQVTSPADNATIFINSDNLNIKVSVVPAIRSHLGHKLQILFDGTVLVEDTNSYTLDDADRGSHNISARIIDKNDRVIERSESVTVHIKKPTI